MRSTLALLGPALVMGGWLWSTGFFDPEQSSPALRPSQATKQVLDRLATKPEIIMFGNSQAAAAVDLVVLGEALGLPGKAEAVTVGGAFAPLAWTIARHRVFDAGLRPKLLLVPMSVPHLLDTAVPEGKQLNYLQQQLTGPDPVLDDKVFGGRNQRLDTAIAAAQTWRESLLEHVTALPLHLLGGASADERMDKARDAVFGQVAGAQLVLNARMIPIVEGGAATKVSAANIDLERTLVPDLLALANEHGVHIVFVTLPQQSRDLATPRPLLKKLAAYIGERGGGLANLEGLAIPSDGWIDGGHLNQRGSGVLTEALIGALKELEALGPGPIKPLPPPIDPPQVKRLGDPRPPRITKVVPTDNPCFFKVPIDGAKHLSDAATLDAGLGNASPLVLSWRGRPLKPHGFFKPDTTCVGAFTHTNDVLLVSPPEPGLAVGDLELAWSPETPHSRRIGGAFGITEYESWWLPASGSLQLDWPDPLKVNAGDQLNVLLTPLNAGEGSWTVRVGDQEVVLTAWESLRYATIPLPAGPLGHIELSAAHGSPDAFLRALVLVQGSTHAWIAGRSDERADQLALVAGVSIDAPKALPERLVAARSTTHDRLLSWTVSGYDAEVTEARMIVAGNDQQCGRFLPFEPRSLADGSNLDLDTRQSESGTVWSMFGGNLPTPGPDDAWSLHTHHNRVRARNLWVHPGEAITITARQPRSLAVSADTLDLSLAAFGSHGQLSFRFIGPDGVVRVEQTLDASTLDGAPLTFPLSSPIAPLPDRLTLEITAPADSWVLLAPSMLRSQHHPEDAWFAVEPKPTPRIQSPDVFTPRVLAQPVAPAAIPATLTAQPDGPALFDLHPWLPAGLGSFIMVPGTLPAPLPAEGDGGPGIRLSGPADSRPMVCLPDLPSTGPVISTARVRIEGGAEPGVGVLDARWTVGRQAIRGPDGNPLLSTSRVQKLGAEWQTVTLSSPPAPGASAVRICLRRHGTGDLVVGAWTVHAAAEP